MTGDMYIDLYKHARDGRLAIIAPGTRDGQPCYSYQVVTVTGKARRIARHRDDEMRIAFIVTLLQNLHRRAWLEHGITEPQPIA